MMGRKFQMFSVRDQVCQIVCPKCKAQQNHPCTNLPEGLISHVERAEAYFAGVLEPLVTGRKPAKSVAMSQEGEDIA